jgi:hypothetical protein
VCADHDLNLAGLQGLAGLVGLLGRHEA